MCSLFNFFNLENQFLFGCLRRSSGGSGPEIASTDQGVQFTSEEFTSTLKQAGCRMSRDGKGRVFDNIFVERLWRSVKYEEGYLHEYRTGWDAEKGLSRYFCHYNEERPHQSLQNMIPAEVYLGGKRMCANDF